MNKESTDSDLAFTTHVGRDVLQNAAMFSSPPKAVLEYVLNSLQYVDTGISPIIYVNIDVANRVIEIADNGRGMSRSDLSNFFTMHAPNQDRTDGRPGRGFYGTGKSAGLGVGKEIEIDTVRNQIRNVVSITRAALERGDGTEIPLNDLIVDAPKPGAPNGTVVRIRGVKKDRLNPSPIIESIERNLTFWRHAEPTVSVGSHLCEVRLPSIAFTETIRPEGRLADILGGSLEMSISAAHAPLPVTQQGIFVLAGEGHLVAVEKVGVDKKRFGNQVFGQVVCPALLAPAGQDDPVEAVDASRSLSLNGEHPVARALKLFIAHGLETARLRLESKYEEERDKASRQQLHDEADKIADLLNRDLQQVADRIEQLNEIRAHTGASSKGGAGDGAGTGAYRSGGDLSGLIDDDSRDIPEEPGSGDGGPGGRGEGGAATESEQSDKVRPVSKDPKRRRKSGGLKVDFLAVGEDNFRAYYDENHSTIVVNLEHPQLVAAQGSAGTDDPAFRRTAYEVAFTEYAQVIARAVSQQEGFVDPSDLLFEINDAIDRVSRAAVPLYSGLL